MPHQKTEQVNVRLAADVKKRGEQYARARGMSLGEFIRHALADYMNRNPK